jgi:hypothetical protein
MKHSKAAPIKSINQTYDIGYWARHWKVSVMQIAEAIRYTGSNRINELRRYLRQRELI